MLVIKRVNKKKIILLGLVILLALGISGYLIFNAYFSDKTNFIKPKIKFGSELVMIPKIETRFEADFLGKEPYIKLRQHGQLPVEVGSIGRSNPFLPTGTTTTAGFFEF